VADFLRLAGEAGGKRGVEWSRERKKAQKGQQRGADRKKPAFGVRAKAGRYLPEG